MQRLDGQFENVYINILSSSDGNRHSLVQLLKDTSELQSMLAEYTGIAVDNENSIFDQVWGRMLKELPASCTLSAADVQKRLLSPAIEECTQLLSKLQQHTITLLEVEEYFGQFKNNRDIALTNAIKLLRGLSSCNQGAEKRIEESIDLIQNYWSLCTLANAAKFCCELKQALKLEGDFEKVEDLTQWVSLD